jgi:hypothetical protein
VAADHEEAVRATERWFVRRGLPHFVYRFRSSRDVWVAVVPVVLLLFVIEIAVLAPNEDYPILGSIAAVVGGVAALLALWAVVNRLRGRHWLARPDRIGPVEVLVFVFGPALIPLAFGGQWRSAVVTAAINLAVLVLAYLERRYAVVSLAVWTLRHLGDRLRTVSGVIVRALPLLLIVVVLIFFTVETWQLAHDLRWPVLLIGLSIFVGLAISFAVIRAPEQIGEVEADVDARHLRELVTGTPAEPLVKSRRGRTAPPLSPSERRNVRMVVVVSELTLVTIVSGAMFLFLIVVGLIVLPLSLQDTWIGAPPTVWFSFDLFGERLGMTVETVKVAGFVAAFAALQFTVSLLSDRAYLDEFLGDLRESLRCSLAVRVVYLETVLRGS